MACAAAVQVHAAGITISPPDSPASMAGLSVDLECDDLVVNGTRDMTGATFNRVGNLIIGPALVGYIPRVTPLKASVFFRHLPPYSRRTYQP